MAYPTDSNPLAGGQPGNTSDSTSGPVYDLRGGGAPAPPPQQPASPYPGLQVVGQEQIEIAPHPTTNRFPWAPVDNPTVPVYQVVPPPQPPAPAPLPPTPQPVFNLPPAVQSPPPPLPTPAPEPEPDLVLESLAPPEPSPTPPPIAAAPPVAPPPPPVMPPAPELVPFPPQPLDAPVRVPPPPVPTTPVQPPEPEPKPVFAPPPAAKPVKHGRRVYSVQTREVWRVFRIGRKLRVMYIIALVLFAGAAAYLWLELGTPSNVFDLKLLQPILNAQ